MANDEDVENQSHIDRHEETPLLHREESNLEQASSSEPENKRRSWFLWRLLWAVVAAVILTVFIKGWIDAGSDVNVGIYQIKTPQRNT